MSDGIKYQDATGTLISVSSANPLPTMGGGGGGGGAVTAASGAFVDGSIVTIGAEADTPNTSGTGSGTLMSFLKGAVSRLALLAAAVLTPYSSPDGRKVNVVSNMGVLFSDGFGGAAIDTTVRWDVLDGGLPANPTLHGQSLVQSAIGSGVAMGNGVNTAANTALSVASSALTVSMGTTANAELWLLSQQAFAGTEDLTVLLSKSQSLVADSIFVGLVEVDPTTLIPIYNANTPSYTQGGNACAFYFTNAGGVELGMTTTSTAYTAVAVEDSSSTAALGSVGVANAAMTAASEFLVEFHAEDIIVSNTTVDSMAGKNTTPSRVSTQCPNDGKVYKLLIRFRNVAAPGSNTTVTIPRILIVDSQEMRVEVASGRGDQNAQKAISTFIAGTGSGVNFNSILKPTNAQGVSMLRITTGASGVVTAAAFRNLYSYDLYNTQATARFLQVYNKATAGVPGTDTPVMTIPIPATARAALSLDVAWYGWAAGISWAITTDAPGATIGASGDVVGTVGYN